MKSNITFEINRLITTIKIEDELAKASEQMEIKEIFDLAEGKGVQYASGYKEGWRDFALVNAVHRLKRMKSVSGKKEELSKRLGLGWHRLSKMGDNAISPD